MREKKGKVSPLWVSYEMEERCMVDLGNVHKWQTQWHVSWHVCLLHASWGLDL